MNLTDHFTLERLTHSDYAVRNNIDNTPNADQIENLKTLAQTLERVQKLLGGEIHVNSGYRCLKLNAALKGSQNPPSAHLEGYAADFTCPSFGTPLEICTAISKNRIPFDQLILEFGAWTHISVNPRMRQEVLTAHFTNGKVTYTQGLA